jgi:hypothetical protein
MQRGRVHILGASGSGTTTLAAALASAWSVPHADADDYYWLPTDPPFTEKRAEADRVALMRAVFAPRRAWVLSGSMMGWGDSIVAECDAVVFVTLDPVERMRRLEARERRRREGGPLKDEAWTVFRDWAQGYDDPGFEGRSRATHDAWLATLDIPVLRLDGIHPTAHLLDGVLRWNPT